MTDEQRAAHQKHGRQMLAASGDKPRDRKAFDDDAAGYIQRYPDAVGPALAQERGHQADAEHAPVAKKAARRARKASPPKGSTSTRSTKK
jgi:hypothetical protein